MKQKHAVSRKESIHLFHNQDIYQIEVASEIHFYLGERFPFEKQAFRNANQNYSVFKNEKVLHAAHCVD